MSRWLLRRCLALLPTLLGITFVTFLLLDLAPLDRASLEVAQRQGDGQLAENRSRDLALLRLRIRYGLVDPRTHEPVPLLQRYLRWLGKAVRLDLAGPDEATAEFWRRLGSAFAISVLLGSWALLFAFLVGVPLGTWLGMHAGSRADRAASGVAFVLNACPEVLVATLLSLAFGTAWLGWLPTTGLRSAGAAQLGALGKLLDLAHHLVLPVLVLTLAPLLLIVRFLRESVARAAASPFAFNLRAWGVEPAVIRRRLLRAGAAPLATLAGSLLPALVGGSIVVETVFSIEGVGRLFWNAVRTQDQAMVMTVTLATSVATLCALAGSDLLHRAVDPRVRLER